MQMPPILLKVNARGWDANGAWDNVPGSVEGCFAGGVYLVWVGVGEMQPGREYRFELENVPGTLPVSAFLNQWDAASNRPIVSTCNFVTLAVNRGPNVVRVNGSHDGPAPLRAAVGLMVTFASA